MPAASLRALLEHAVDYAGLFPPAELSLGPALENQNAYVRSDDSWMLGAFILPIAKFSAAAAQFPLFDAGHPLRISALGPKTSTAAEFSTALGQAASAIKSLADNSPVVSIEQLEMPLPPGPALDSLGVARSVRAQLPLKVFWEIAAECAIEAIEALVEIGAGFKLRTGGVTADAFPTSAQIAQALVTSARYEVPIKFTAGLHHPVRLFHPSVKTKMHGFLNVLGAGVLAAEHGWDAAQTEKMLEDEDPTAFRFNRDGFSWREWEISTAQIAARRRFVTSLGSCSFDEPREDLRALGIL